MSARAYTRPLAVVLGLNGAYPITTMEGYMTVIRCVDVYWGGGVLPVDFYLKGSAGQTIWHQAFAVGGGTWAQWRGRQAIGALEAWELHTNDPMDVTVTGYELEDG